MAAALLGFIAFIVLAGLVKADVVSPTGAVFVIAAAVVLIDVAWTGVRSAARPGGAAAPDSQAGRPARTETASRSTAPANN